MAQTKAGGIKARDTNIRKNGADFYERIGQQGGSVKGIKKGFALNREAAAIAGRKGGKNSKRVKVL